MRGLKGAVINSLYLMRTRSTAVYLAAAGAVLAGCLIVGGPIFFFLAQFSLIAFLPIAVLEMTEVSFITRWNVFEKSWGIPPLLMVLSRYIVFVGVSLLCTGPWLMPPLQGMFAADSYLQDLRVLFLWGQLTCIAYYPLMYLLNPNRKSASAVILIAAMIGAGLLSFGVFPRFAGDNLWLTLAVIAGLYAASVILSAAFDKFHRGRAAQ